MAGLSRSTEQRHVQKASPVEPPLLSFYRFFPADRPFPTVTITSTPNEDFMYSGLESCFNESVALRFLQAHVKGDVATPFRSFLSSFRENHLVPTEHTAFWFRISIKLKSTKPYDIPEWHQDGSTWDTGPEDMPYKVGTVLLGDPTLFLEPKEEYPLMLRQSYERVWNPSYSKEKDDMERLWRAEQFKKAKVLYGKPGELIRWVIASEKFAVVHSEPPVHGPRIFVEVQPGTEAQIRELCRRWGRVFVDGKK